MRDAREPKTVGSMRQGSGSIPWPVQGLSRADNDRYIRLTNCVQNGQDVIGCVVDRGSAGDRSETKYLDRSFGLREEPGDRSGVVHTHIGIYDDGQRRLV